MFSAVKNRRWISSLEGDQESLKNLDLALSSYYSNESSRASYQAMLDTVDCELSEDSYHFRTIEWIRRRAPRRVAEIGCGSGRCYRQLVRSGWKGEYHGFEMAPYIIEENRRLFPEAKWNSGSGYQIKLEDDSVDLLFSFFVIEHLVYPAKALEEMLRVVRPSGAICLGFPDMVASGKFPSQQCGAFPNRRLREKLRTGNWIDLAFTLFDRHFLLPLALRNASKSVGPFPINLAPLNLSCPNLMWPDIDAIYIASAEEIKNWAEKQGCFVEFPFGRNGEWHRCPFLVLRKRG